MFQKIRIGWRIRRGWKIYNQLRKLRTEHNKLLKAYENLDKICKQRECTAQVYWNHIVDLKEQLKHNGHRIDFCVPTSKAIMSPYSVNPYAEEHRAEQIEQKLTDRMKIQLVNRMLEHGWIKKTQTNDFETIYSLWVMEEI